jgi:pilus assembly protein Flp/PilA
MNALVARFVREESGQDLIEYGLLVGIITSVSVLTIRSLGGIVQNFYTQLQTNLTSAP